MRCGFDITCHLWSWFWGLPWWVHWGLLACLALAAWGFAARLWSIAKGLGGWQAAVAALGAVALVAAAVLNRKPTPEVHEHVAGRDAAPPVPKSRPKSKGPVLRKPRETVQDWFKRVTGQD